MWYLQAALGGNPSAQYNPAIMYIKGEGVRPDRQKAMEWFEKAATNGSTEAQEALKKLQ